MATVKHYCWGCERVFELENLADAGGRFYCVRCWPEGHKPSPPMEDAPTSEVEIAELVKCSDMSVAWEHTRRGLIGISEVRTPRPSGPDLVTWVWFTETADTGLVHGADGRAMALADAYRAMVRAELGAPVFPWTC